jgi:general secretion pathway protein F
MMFDLRLLHLESGAVSTQRLTADTAQQACLQAQAEGMRVLSVQKHTRWRDSLAPVKKALNYPLFCRELRTLMVAGMGVVEAVDTLCEFDLKGQKNTALSESSLPKQLREGLRRGQSVSNALEGMESVPAVLLACVRSVEHTSNLLEALDDYLRYHEMLAQLRSKVVSAAIYPAIVTALGVGVTLFLLTVVMPQFAQMYGQLRGQAEGLTALIIGLSEVLANHRPAFLTGLLTLFFGLWVWFGSGRGGESLSRWMWRMPWVRQQLMDYQLALFYQSLHLMTKGGYALVPALEVARKASLSPLLQDQVLLCQNEIEQGKSVAASLYRAGLANEVDRRLLAAAEDNGEFFRVAQGIAQLHRSRFELMVERLTRIAEPVLLMLVALMVGSIVVVMYLPVFEMGALSR